MTAGEIVTICGVVIAALSLTYSTLKDVRRNAREDGKASTVLEDIKKSLLDLHDGINRLEGRQAGFAERLSAVEQSTKSAHYRINGIEERIKL